jgi:hypothetical protein
MEWGAVITGVLAIVSTLLKWWMDNAPARAQESSDEDKEKLREAISSGDAIALGAAIDSVPDNTSNTTGQPTDQDIERGLAKITGS